MIFDTWQDFVIYPFDPDRIHSREERLNTEHVCSVLDEQNPKERVAVCTSEEILWGNDPFEAMEIDDYGNVLIWTRDKVWCLRRLHGMEKLLYLARYPDLSQARKRRLWFGLIISILATPFTGGSIILYAWLGTVSPERWPLEKASLWSFGSLILFLFFLVLFLYCIIVLIKDVNRRYRRNTS